jgi:hypothetical protein
MYALLNPRDEVELPSAAFDLPRTKRHEQHKEQNGHRAGDGQKQRGAATLLAAGIAGVAGLPAGTAECRPTSHPCAIARRRLDSLPCAIAWRRLDSLPCAIAWRRLASHPCAIAWRPHGMLCMFIIESGIIL